MENLILTKDLVGNRYLEKSHKDIKEGSVFSFTDDYNRTYTATVCNRTERYVDVMVKSPYKMKTYPHWLYGDNSVEWVPTPDYKDRVIIRAGMKRVKTGRMVPDESLFAKYARDGKPVKEEVVEVFDGWYIECRTKYDKPYTRPFWLVE